jgi:hypothetical protein
MRSRLTATDRTDDFQLVIRVQLHLGKLATRHNIAITLNRNALACQLHLLDQRLHTHGLCGKLHGFTIDENLHAAFKGFIKQADILRKISGFGFQFLRHMVSSHLQHVSSNLEEYALF